MKVLLAGVPFGRNNAGDEAILECIVETIRHLVPDAELIVSTDEPAATAQKLDVSCVELFGFTPGYNRLRMRQYLSEVDVFIWAGATGLSDYPVIPLKMMQIAQQAGTRTVVWGVGMNDEFNPVTHRIQPGRRQQILNFFSALTLHNINVVSLLEQFQAKRVRRKIVRILNRAHLVMLRDPETWEAVQACGAVPNALVGADPAEELIPEPWEEVRLSDEESEMLGSKERKVGLCVSAQREIVHRDALVAFLDRLIESDHRIVFLPMNHVTDARLMRELRERMKHPEHSVVMRGRREPREILAIAGRLDLVISSRLHLLILASVVHVPIIGISRGSKVDNFLAPFGHLSAGTVEQCDFDHMQRELDRLIDSRDEFMEVSTAVHELLLSRLAEAKTRLAELLDQ